MLVVKIFLLTIFALVYVALARRVGAPKLGSGLVSASGVERLEKALVQVASSGGPQYKIAKVNSVITQKVGGILYTYDVNLQNEGLEKNCLAKIWSRPAGQAFGTNIKIICNGLQEFDKSF